jgi:GLPGLI family protein
MKTTVILLLLFCILSDTYAQQTIEITYESFSVPEGSSLYHIKVPDTQSQFERDIADSEKKWRWHLVISGDTTLTFSSSDKREKKKYLKDGVYANKPIHHSGYYVSSNHNHFATVAFKGKYFIRSEDMPSPKNYWMDTTKTILNYECQAAMIYNDYGDSSTMWIARNVKPGLVTNHNGFVVPGIAMESLILKHGTYYKAVNVEKTNNKIHFQKDYPQISRQEHLRRKKIK